MALTVHLSVTVISNYAAVGGYDPDAGTVSVLVNIRVPLKTSFLSSPSQLDAIEAQLKAALGFSSVRGTFPCPPSALHPGAPSAPLSSVSLLGALTQACKWPHRVTHTLLQLLGNPVTCQQLSVAGEDISGGSSSEI